MGSSSENVPNYEELFAHRFTTEDKEYQEYLQRPPDPPPVVEDWRGRVGGYQRGRDNRFQDQRHHRGREKGHGWSGDQRHSSHWSDRRWSPSGRPQTGQHNSYNQGYNSNNPRYHDQY